jgi:hypothetical protein
VGGFNFLSFSKKSERQSNRLLSKKCFSHKKKKSLSTAAMDATRNMNLRFIDPANQNVPLKESTGVNSPVGEHLKTY